jgi:hypothetical protein
MAVSLHHPTIAAAAVVVAVAVAATAGAGVLGDPTTYEQARRYLGRHAADVSMVAYTVAPDGTPDATDPAIEHNADVPMPLASTIKIVLLAGYAREVVAGRLDPEQPVPLADWERFYLPATDGNAHPDALADLGIATDESGFAADPSAVVPLRSLIWAMIAHSDNAAADWVLERIGREGWEETVRDGGLVGQDTQLPILGQFLAWANHERPALSDGEIAAFAGSPETYAVEAWRLVAAFQDPVWRAAELRWRLEGHDPSTLWSEARLADTLAPRGTARDYARMLAGVVAGTFISPEVSSLMRETLEWPLADPGFAQVFEAFGTKGGSFSRVLTEATYAVPKIGDFTGRPRVCVLFLRRMPMLSWLTMSLTGPHQVLELGVLGSRDFTDKVAATLADRR